MHFEVLVEDQSGSIALDVVPEKILGAKCEWARANRAAHGR